MRREFADDLADSTGLKVHPNVPNKMTPPCLVLHPDDPWVDTGDVYGSWRVRFVLSVYVRFTDYDKVIDGIEAVLPGVLAALGDDWGVDQVNEPLVADISGKSVPFVDLHVSRFTESL